VAVFLYGLRLCFPPERTILIGVPVLIFILAAVPSFLSITSELSHRETPILRRLVMAQTLLVIFLFVRLASFIVQFTGKMSFVNGPLFNWVLALQGLFLAVSATIRLFGATDHEERRFFYLVSVTMWAGFLLSSVRNAMTLQANSIFWDIELDVGYLVAPVMFLGFYNPPAWLTRFQPSRAMIRFSKVSSSLLEGMMLVSVGLAVTRFHFVEGGIGIALAIALYVWRHGLIQMRLEDAEGHLIAANGKLEDLIVLDALTGIPNRRGFESELRREGEIASRASYPVGLIMIDIDYFKLLNDTCGHEEGDRCLRLVAEALSHATPRSRDFIARYGGEEFVGIFPGVSIAGLERIAQKLSEAVRTLHVPHPASPTGYLTISIGAALGTVSNMESLQHLLRLADENLYEAKRSGRNRSVCKEASQLSAEKVVPAEVVVPPVQLEANSPLV
jgi:diguanylate cyclase (GGDEF)-like protein